jgi:phosphate transport system substrate-binding protein
MKKNKHGLIKCIIAVSLVLGLYGCKGDKGTSEPQKEVISNSGSDTMVNLAQMWAEEYQKVKPEVSVEVAGGGSGVGIRDLIQGTVDIANCSREMKEPEKDQAKRNTGKDPVEWIVGYDALAVYVNKKNPVETLTLEQLASVYEEGGPVDKWSQLNIDLKAVGGNDEIVRVSRQNSSGTYFYFREVVLGNRDYKPGSRDMSGSKDVVELVGNTIGAIGYSGMGYVTNAVKFVKLSAGEGKVPYEPSLENVAAGHYPLARPLRMYTHGQPQGAAKEYIEWILSPAGQKIVADSGYIPVSAISK